MPQYKIVILLIHKYIILYKADGAQAAFSIFGCALQSFLIFVCMLFKNKSKG